MAARIPSHLVDDCADRVREVLCPRPIQGDFGDSVLTFDGFAARLKVDVLRETLQIVLAAIRTRNLPLQRMRINRLDMLPAHICEAHDPDDAQNRYPGHRIEPQPVSAMEQPV